MPLDGIPEQRIVAWQGFGSGQAQRRKTIARLRQKGLSFAKIGRRLKISKQYAWRLTRDLRPVYRPVPIKSFTALRKEQRKATKKLRQAMVEGFHEQEKHLVERQERIRVAPQVNALVDKGVTDESLDSIMRWVGTHLNDSRVTMENAPSAFHYNYLQHVKRLDPADQKQFWDKVATVLPKKNAPEPAESVAETKAEKKSREELFAVLEKSLTLEDHQ